MTLGAKRTLDPAQAPRHRCCREDARVEAPREGERSGRLTIQGQHVATSAQKKDVGRRTAPTPNRARLTWLLIGVAMTSVAAASAEAQSINPPQPAPRPRQASPAPPQQAPVEPQAASPSPAPAHQPPQSRQEMRALQRACAQDWSRRKMAGQTDRMTWIEFFEICSKQR